MATRHLIPAALLLLASCFAGAAPVTTNNPAVSAAYACTGTKIDPSMSTTTINAALATNTTYCWASGTYNVSTYFTLPSGSTHICPVRRSCILDGGGTALGGFFTTYGDSNTTVRGFTVRNMGNPVGGSYYACVQGRVGSLIEDNDVSTCRFGFGMEGGSTLRLNHAHHNRCEGFGGGPGDNVLVELNEIDNNNTNHENIGTDCSGLKMVGSAAGSDNFIVRGNFVHDNWGQGIWCDGNCTNGIIEDNHVVNNYGVGIFWEISWAADIRRNQLADNDTVDAGQSCSWGSQIHVNNSQGVRIYDNTVEVNGVNSICLTNTTRSEAAWFPQFLANVWVQDNKISMRGTSHFGLTATSTNINYRRNEYLCLGGCTTAYWEWLGVNKTQAQWTALGNDTLYNTMYGTAGAMPTLTWVNSDYFQDVVFTPTGGSAVSIHTSQTPVVTNHDNGAAVELCTNFHTTADGAINSIKFYKAASDSATYVGKIRSANGTILTSVTFSGVGASGWQTQALASAYAVKAGVNYLVCTNAGRYFPYTQSGLDTPIVNGSISSSDASFTTW